MFIVSQKSGVSIYRMVSYSFGPSVVAIANCPQFLPDAWEVLFALLAGFFAYQNYKNTIALQKAERLGQSEEEPQRDIFEALI